MDFDRRLRACARRWHLQAGDQLAGGFRSEVVSCAAADGTQVVVKLVVTREEMQAEAAALTAWAGTGAAVRLLDTDFDHGALLLEQIRPGTHLPGNDDPGAIDVAASLLGALHRAPLPAFPFPALQETLTGKERHPPAATILHKAGAIAELMGLDPHRARRWAAAWTVLQECQAWRDDQSELDAALSTAEFDHLIRA